MTPERRTRGSIISAPRDRRHETADGPGELLGAIVAAHGGALRSFVSQLTSDRHQAEDIVQETLVRAWSHPEAFDGTRGSPRAWLFTVARRVAVDNWRRDSRRRHTEGERSGPDRADYLPERLDRMVDDWIIAGALEGLSPQHREVLLHTVWLDRSVAETAKALSIPPGTVKSRTYYALRALRLSLEEMGFFS